MNILTENLGLILQGLGTTLMISVVSGVGAIILGTLVGILRVSPLPLLRGVAFVYVQFIVNVPLLAIMILAVFALPAAGLLLPLLPTIIIVLITYEAAYVAEAIRSGINTIAGGELEAARALGMTLSQSLRSIVVPQSIRVVIQPIGNIMIILAMDSALAAVIGINELTASVNDINLVYAQPILLYTGAGLVYMAIALVIGTATGWLERRLVIAR